MKKYVLQKSIKERKIGQIVELDNNSFFTLYYLKKGIIIPFQEEKQEKQQKVQGEDTNAVKTTKKTSKKGSKKK